MDAVFEKKAYFQLRGIYAKGFRGYMPMFHPHGEILFVTKGSIPITVDGKSHLLTQGEMAILFPYLPHAYEDAPDADAIVLLFDPMQTAFDNTLLHSRPVQCYTQAQTLQPLLERVIYMLKRNRIKTATAYLNAILGELLELLTLEPIKDASPEITVRLLAYCDEHYTQDITVKSAAEALFLSESYVSKIFSRNLKYGFREYINALRVHKAQMLLENSHLPIAQVMAQCGFQNQSSFNRIFRSLCGTAPGDYRKALRNGEGR